MATDNTAEHLHGDRTYTLVTDDQGKTIKVKVSFTTSTPDAHQRGDGEFLSHGGCEPPATGPTITGTATVGQDLTAHKRHIMWTGCRGQAVRGRLDGSDSHFGGDLEHLYAADRGQRQEGKGEGKLHRRLHHRAVTSDAYPSSGTIGTPNARPTAADGTVTTNEDTDYTFSAATSISRTQTPATRSQA